MSDNANVALAITDACRRWRGRCAPHVIYIPIRVVCFCPWPRGAKAPRPVPAAGTPPPPDVELVKGLECLRAWSDRFDDPGFYEQWCRGGHWLEDVFHHYGGPKKKRTHTDSNSSWGSTLRLINDSLDLRQDMTLFKAEDEEAPSLPTVGQWDRVVSLRSALEVHQCAVDELQATVARIAQVVPVCMYMLHRLDLLVERVPECDRPKPKYTVPLAFTNALRKSIEDHLKALWKIPAGPRQLLHTALAKSEIVSYYNLCQVEGLLACGPLEESHAYMGLCLPQVRRSLELLATEISKIEQPDMWLVQGVQHPPVSKASPKLKVLSSQGASIKAKAKIQKRTFRAGLPGPSEKATSSDPRLSNPAEKITLKIRSLLTSEVLPGRDNESANGGSHLLQLLTPCCYQRHVS